MSARLVTTPWLTKNFAGVALDTGGLLENARAGARSANGTAARLTPRTGNRRPEACGELDPETSTLDGGATSDGIREESTRGRPLAANPSRGATRTPASAYAVAVAPPSPPPVMRGDGFGAGRHENLAAEPPRIIRPCCSRSTSATRTSRVGLFKAGRSSRPAAPATNQRATRRRARPPARRPAPPRRPRPSPTSGDRLLPPSCRP